MSYRQCGDMGSNLHHHNSAKCTKSFPIDTPIYNKSMGSGQIDVMGLRYGGDYVINF